MQGFTTKKSIFQCKSVKGEIALLKHGKGSLQDQCVYSKKWKPLKDNKK